jgi:cell division GTPase FtsZ
MKVGIVNIGQAGGKVADELLEYENRIGNGFISDVIAVNTAKADLFGLEHVPLEKRILIGQSRVKGHGAGANNELGAQIAQEDLEEVMSAVSDFPISNIDAFLVMAGLGGGSGGGGAPVVARELKRRYEEPVYGFGILPSRGEGGLYHLNAARSFRTFVEQVDNLILFDNEGWRRGGNESLKTGYDYINREIATRLGVLLTAGETASTTPESVVDSSEIINTLAGGDISSLGYATSSLARAHRGLLERFSSKPKFEPEDTINQIVATVRQAALGRLTLPCELDGTRRGLVIVAGPPDALNRRGIERSISWLEEQTGTKEIRGGDYPLSGENDIAVLIVLSGISDSPRLQELQRVAIETQRNVKQIQEDGPEAFEELIWGGGDELDPLF